MNNHYHLLASTPDKNLPTIMNRLHTEISIAINTSAGHTNHVFGGRYKACEIKNMNYLYNAIKYVYQNPLRAGICKSAEFYPYSTLSGAYGFSHLQIHLDRTYDEALFKDLGFDYVDKMNERLPEEHCLLLTKHLKRVCLDKISDSRRRPRKL
jgi:putative transposase